MAEDFAFNISTTRFDEDYAPSESSRITTNFANLRAASAVRRTSAAPSR
jgi:hypothetical protein